jgi:phospholipase C
MVALCSSPSGAAESLKTKPTPIQHVVVIVQENRSFNSLFNGYPGAVTVTEGLDSTGHTVVLSQVGLADTAAIGHGSADFLSAWDNGKMDGFDLEEGAGPPGYGSYEYVPKREVAPYWAMAAQYALNDNTFSSQLDDSFEAHQYLIAAQAQSSVDSPIRQWGCSDDPSDIVNTLTQQRTYGPVQAPCFDYTTLADELDAKYLTWRFYAPAIRDEGIWSAYQAINHIYQGGNGAQWLANVISPETGVLTLAPNGILPSVTWVVPDWANSDHPGNSSATGPSWVTSVVNTIGESSYWSSTVIFVLWDDWGGAYDPVPPPQLDYDGLGIRIPLLCISPYAVKGRVMHQQLETASIPRFIEDNFGLPQMAASDRRARSAGAGCLDFKQTPRAFVPISADYPAAHFIQERPSGTAPDDD